MSKDIKTEKPISIENKDIKTESDLLPDIYNEPNEDTKIIPDKENKLKQYRQEYYKNNKEKLLNNAKELKKKKLDIKTRYNESQLKFSDEMKLFEKKYKDIESNRSKLVSIKQDYKILKHLTNDDTKVSYVNYTFDEWLIKLNDLIESNKKIIDIKILNKLGLNPIISEKQNK